MTFNRVSFCQNLFELHQNLYACLQYVQTMWTKFDKDPLKTGELCTVKVLQMDGQTDEQTDIQEQILKTCQIPARLPPPPPTDFCHMGDMKSKMSLC